MQLLPVIGQVLPVVRLRRQSFNQNHISFPLSEALPGTASFTRAVNDQPTDLGYFGCFKFGWAVRYWIRWRLLTFWL